MSSEAFRELFDNLDAQLQQAQNSSAVPAELTENPVTAEGSDDDDRLRVTVTNGRLTEVTIQPQLLRLGNAELAALFVTATNNALEAYQAALMESLRDLSPDLGALQGQVRQVQEESLRSLNAYADSMLEMLRRAKSE